MTKAEQFIRNHEAIKARAIYNIFRKESAKFQALLEKQDKSIRLLKAYKYERKISQSDLLDPFLDDIAPDVPEYLIRVLPKIMTEGSKNSITRYKDLLPKGYSLAFDVDTSPAAKYLKDLEDLYLSQRDGSILKTTRDELLKIMEDGVAAGDSYGQIAKKIRETDPWVFSKARATLISVNEIGRAYGWANHEPAVQLQRDGYVLKKLWMTSHDDKVRRTHTMNEAAGYIALDKPFPGTLDQFAPSTNEIRCRCTSTHKIVGISGEKGIIPIAAGTPTKEIAKKHFEIFSKGV